MDCAASRKQKLACKRRIHDGPRLMCGGLGLLAECLHEGIDNHRVIICSRILRNLKHQGHGLRSHQEMNHRGDQDQ